MLLIKIAFVLALLQVQHNVTHGKPQRVWCITSPSCPVQIAFVLDLPLVKLNQ